MRDAGRGRLRAKTGAASPVCGDCREAARAPVGRDGRGGVTRARGALKIASFPMKPWRLDKRRSGLLSSLSSLRTFK